MESNKRPKYIIGLTGHFGSGKSTAAFIFKSHGYQVKTLSKPLREEVVKRRLKVNRKNLQDIGNEWREKYGLGILVKKVLHESNHDKIIIDGVRNLGEVNEIKKQNGTVVAFVADKKIRYKRINNRSKKLGEEISEEEFDKLNKRDLGVGEEKNGQQVAFCIAFADYYIDSNSTLDKFKESVNAFIKKYER